MRRWMWTLTGALALSVVGSTAAGGNSEETRHLNRAQVKCWPSTTQNNPLFNREFDYVEVTGNSVYMWKDGKATRFVGGACLIEYVEKVKEPK